MKFFNSSPKRDFNMWRKKMKMKKSKISLLVLLAAYAGTSKTAGYPSDEDLLKSKWPEELVHEAGQHEQDTATASLVRDSKEALRFRKAILEDIHKKQFAETLEGELRKIISILEDSTKRYYASNYEDLPAIKSNMSLPWISEHDRKKLEVMHEKITANKKASDEKTYNYTFEEI